MPVKPLTKVQAQGDFNRVVLPKLRAKYGRPHAVTLATAWSSFLDCLVDLGQITRAQRYRWINPYL